MEDRVSVLIRASTDADIPAITAIYGWNVLNGLGTFEEVPPDAAEMARRRQGFLERGLPYLVAELDGKVVGYCYAGPFRLRAAYRYTVEDSVYVSPEAVGAGVGKALLAALIARADEPAGAAQCVRGLAAEGDAAAVRMLQPGGDPGHRIGHA